MGHLVRDLRGNEEIGLLPEIYKIVAKQLLLHRRRELSGIELESITFDNLCKVVQDTESMVSLSQAQNECNELLKARRIDDVPLLGKESEQPGEMFNNLGQIEVLAKVVEFLKTDSSYSFTACAPTQQHLDRDKQQITDLEGIVKKGVASRPWILEAFGGKDLENNSKLYKDLYGLLIRKRRLKDAQLFLAFRKQAWTWKKSLPRRSAITKKGTPKGKKKKVEAKLREFAEHKDVLIVEVTDLKRVKS